MSLFSSGRRDSNPRPSAWKADALSTELLPQTVLWVEMDSNHRSDDAADLQSAPFGHSGIYPSLSVRASCRIRTNDPEITNHVLWPTELKRRLSSRIEIRGVLVCGCKGTAIFLTDKLFRTFFSKKILTIKPNSVQSSIYQYITRTQKVLTASEAFAL